MPPMKNVSGSLSSNEVNRFPSSSRYARNVYDQFAAKKEVLTEKTLDLCYLVKFIPDYLETLREWGWIDLLKTKKYIMPEIVRQFYFFGEDKKYDDKGVAIGPRDFLELPTKLFNKDFVVSVDMMDATIGVNISEGQRALPKMNEIEKNEFLKVVFKKENLERFPLELVKVSNLDVRERILHYVVAQSMFARKRASEITDLDIFCMARIMKKEPFNLSAFVILKMQEACVRIRGEKPFYCPFERLIKVICEKMFEENQLRNVAKVEDRSGDALQENIKLMSFDFDGLRRISPGFEQLDDSIAIALRGGGGLKRKKGQRQIIRGIPGLRFGSSSTSGQREEAVEAPLDEDENISMASLMRVLKRMESNQIEMKSLRSLDTRLQNVELKVDALVANDSDEEVEDEKYFDENDDMES